MTALSININKFALVRNSRGYLPDLQQIVRDLESYGADGITVHPRPDERHIKRSDVYQLAPLIQTEFNIEGYPSRDFIQMILDVKPHQCTLVPDSPEQLTSDHGWDTQKHKTYLQDTIAELHTSGTRVSLFIDTDLAAIEHAQDTGCDRLELYTGPYAEDSTTLELYRHAALRIQELNMAVNAGHDLNLSNLRAFKQALPMLAEVSIGHAFVNDAWYYGLQNTLQMYKRLL